MSTHHTPSLGEVSSAEDLVEDGVAVLSYVHSVVGARPAQVLLYGQSLGSAVAACSAVAIGAEQSESSSSGYYTLVLDRGFSSLVDVGRVYVLVPMNGYGEG